MYLLGRTLFPEKDSLGTDYFSPDDPVSHSKFESLKREKSCDLEIKENETG
jgi:hypothetical protein